MVGTTLVEIREHIEALADDDGEFALVCGRTGERPIPVAGERFGTRAVGPTARCRRSAGPRRARAGAWRSRSPRRTNRRG